MRCQRPGYLRHLPVVEQTGRFDVVFNAIQTWDRTELPQSAQWIADPLLFDRPLQAETFEYLKLPYLRPWQFKKAL
jgi:hypothetical protein